MGIQEHLAVQEPPHLSSHDFTFRFQLPTVNSSPKILNGKFQKKVIHNFEIVDILSSMIKSQSSPTISHPGREPSLGPAHPCYIHSLPSSIGANREHRGLSTLHGFRHLLGVWKHTPTDKGLNYTHS